MKKFISLMSAAAMICALSVVLALAQNNASMKDGAKEDAGTMHDNMKKEEMTSKQGAKEGM